MEICVVVPVIGEHWTEEARVAYSALARPGTVVTAVVVDQGPASIETHYDEALAVPDVLAKIEAAEQAGADAVVIDCMGDPGLEAARELVSIPVIGPGQAAMHLAATLAHKFSAITILERTIPIVHDQVVRYGLTEKLASIRSVEIPVLEIEGNEQRVVSALIDESARAVQEDGAHIIIPGCTGMIGLARQVQEALAERGVMVPVIDAPWAAVKLAESLVDMGLSQSKRTHPSPPAKEITGYTNHRRVAT